MSFSLFKNGIYKMCLEMILFIYKRYLALNNLQWLIWHKIKTDQTFSYTIKFTFGIIHSGKI